MKCKQCDKELSEQSVIPICEDCVEMGVLEMEREAIKDLIMHHRKEVFKQKLMDIGTSLLTLGATIMVAKSLPDTIQDGHYMIALSQTCLCGFMVFNQCRFFGISKNLESNGMELIGLGVQQLSYRRVEIIEAILSGEEKCDWGEWNER